MEEAEWGFRGLIRLSRACSLKLLTVGEPVYRVGQLDPILVSVSVSEPVPEKKSYPFLLC
jgi:hypothetical protein